MSNNVVYSYVRVKEGECGCLAGTVLKQRVETDYLSEVTGLECSLNSDKLYKDTRLLDGDEVDLLCESSYSTLVSLLDAEDFREVMRFLSKYSDELYDTALRDGSMKVSVKEDEPGRIKYSFTFSNGTKTSYYKLPDWLFVLTYRDHSVRYMTLEEIEKALGYKVKITEEKK